MGWFVLVRRLVAADLRRHPGQAVIFLLALLAAGAMVAMGLMSDGATGSLYGQTRAATAGPDVVAFVPEECIGATHDEPAVAQADNGWIAEIWIVFFSDDKFRARHGAVGGCHDTGSLTRSQAKRPDSFQKSLKA